MIPRYPLPFRSDRGQMQASSNQVNTSLFVHETEQDAEVPDSDEELDTDVEESDVDIDNKDKCSDYYCGERQQTIAVVIIQRLIMHMNLIVKAK